MLFFCVCLRALLGWWSLAASCKSLSRGVWCGAAPRFSVAHITPPSLPRVVHSQCTCTECNVCCVCVYRENKTSLFWWLHVFFLHSFWQKAGTKDPVHHTYTHTPPHGLVWWWIRQRETGFLVRVKLGVVMPGTNVGCVNEIHWALHMWHIAHRDTRTQTIHLLPNNRVEITYSCISIINNSTLTP